MQTHIRQVINLRDPDRPWSLRWQAATMAAPAFWYFRAEEDAKQAERDLHRNTAAPARKGQP